MKKRSLLASTIGQIAVEYILLLFVVVTIWLILVKRLVSRDPNLPGIVIQKWGQIIELIGQDNVEKK
ncbi:MAG: hypothetical protein ABL927_07525 [Bdellovibrionales bacterium]